MPGIVVQALENKLNNLESSLALQRAEERSLLDRLVVVRTKMTEQEDAIREVKAALIREKNVRRKHTAV